MANVYVLTGSEDGILGVWGSLKRAKTEAQHYATCGGDSDLESVRETPYEIEYFGGWCSCRIEIMPVR